MYRGSWYLCGSLPYRYPSTMVVSTRKKACEVCGSPERVNGAGKCGACVEGEDEATCPTCEAQVGDEDQGISCDACLRWYHAKCEGMDEAWYRKVEKSKEGWCCRKCMQHLMRQGELVKRLREERDALLAKQRSSDEQVQKLMECLGALEREIRVLREENKALKEQAKAGQTPAVGTAVSAQQEQAEGKGLEVEEGAGKQSPADHSYSEKLKEVKGGDGVVEVTVGAAADTGEARRSEPAAAAAAEGSSSGKSQGEQSGRKEKEGEARPGGGQANSREEQGQSRQRRLEDRDEERAGTWMGVGQHSWNRIMDGKRPVVKEGEGAGRRLWVFGDSLMRGVGREVYCLSKGSYKVMDRSVPGASIRRIHRTVQEHLGELQPEDLVVVEGGGNGLEEIGGEETLRLMEEIVTMVRGRVRRSPLVMCIPMRRGMEGRRFGRERRWVNGRYVQKLEDWKCDGLRLWERVDWRQVWARDGVHLSNVGKVWTAWNVVEWVQHWEEVRQA